MSVTAKISDASVAAIEQDIPTRLPVTTAGMAYKILRGELIWGRWPAGQKLKPQHLKTELNITSSSLREALIRLAAEGFVTVEEQRGFRTLLPTEQSFRELHHLRGLLEKEGAKLSIKIADSEWMERFQSAYHELYLFEKQMTGKAYQDLDLRQWSLLDSAFHASLIAGCGSQILIEQYGIIYDKYRIHAVSELNEAGFRGSTTMDEHYEIFVAIRDLDTAKSMLAIDRHLHIYRRANQK